MRLIDADAFDRALASHEFSAALNEAADKDGPFEDMPMYYSAQSFRDTMRCRPTIDAVPVVRCKDCKYGESETNMFGDDMVMCQNKLNPIGYEDLLMPPEFYCADGERRDGEDGSA